MIDSLVRRNRDCLSVKRVKVDTLKAYDKQVDGFMFFFAKSLSWRPEQAGRWMTRLRYMVMRCSHNQVLAMAG